MKKIQIKPKDMILPSILVLGLLIFFFLVLGQWNQFMDKINELEIEAEKLADLKEKKDLIDNLLKDQEYLLNKEKILKAKIPDRENTSLTYDYLYELMILKNLRAISVESQEPKDEGSYFCIPLRLVVEGEYQNIVSFMVSLGSGERLITTEELYLDRGENDYAPSIIHCEVLVNAYALEINK